MRFLRCCLLPKQVLLGSPPTWPQPGTGDGKKTPEMPDLPFKGMRKGPSGRNMGPSSGQGAAGD